MIKTIEIRVSPECSEKKQLLLNKVSNSLNIDKKNISFLNIKKKSIDARQKIIKINLKIDVYINEKYIEENQPTRYKNVKNAKEVIIIGAGPAGLFAALRLLEMGLKPIIIERGKKVKDRRKDIAKITKDHIINDDSNYCFGEGGAGTFTDGKLYTRSKKRGDVSKILNILVEHGANPIIKIDAHPHIGTNKLQKIIENIRETILNFGGQILYNSRLTDILITNKKVKSITINNKTILDCKKVILATGHSARDIFYLLHSKQSIRDH